MLWTEELFGVKKPILAMLHLDALPGDPRFRRGTPLGEIVEHARADLHRPAGRGRGRDHLL
jgi:Predicted TIM-barrel enzyme